MKLSKIFAITFLGIEGIIALAFVLSLISLSQLILEIIGYSILAIFLIFLNILAIIEIFK